MDWLHQVRRSAVRPHKYAKVGQGDLGWTLVLAERFKEAEVMFQRALAIDPTNKCAQASLEYCREKVGQRGRCGSAV
jgi:hypothetical protein